ncbi:MAG: DoxX family membrane protein [Gemmatimonadales bacterium]|nr:DoxX family membrane protein [Gemmatimonadales bacterium]
MSVTRTDAARIAFGTLFICTGTLHFVAPAYLITIVPSYLPAPGVLVALSGVAEIAGGVGVMIPRTQRVAAIGLVLLLVAVFPANVEMLRLARGRGGPAWVEAVLWLRLPLQALLIWWAWLFTQPSRGPKKHLRG